MRNSVRTSVLVVLASCTALDALAQSDLPVYFSAPPRGARWGASSNGVRAALRYNIGSERYLSALELLLQNVSEKPIRFIVEPNRTHITVQVTAPTGRSETLQQRNDLAQGIAPGNPMDRTIVLPVNTWTAIIVDMDSYPPILNRMMRQRAKPDASLPTGRYYLAAKYCWTPADNQTVGLGGGPLSKYAPAYTRGHLQPWVGCVEAAKYPVDIPRRRVPTRSIR